MRTLWITNDLPPRHGGIERFVDDLLRRLGPHEATVVGPAHPSAAAHDTAAPYRVVRLAGGVWPTPATARTISSVARADPPDVIVLGASWPLAELGPSLRSHAPIVGISHGLEAGVADAGGGFLLRHATASLDGLTTISAYTQRRLEPHVRARQLVRVPPGVDVGAFRPGTDGAPIRERVGVPPGAPLVGCISRLVPRKGQDTLLAAWPTVLAAHPEAWLVIVGDGPYREELRRRAAGLAHVRIVPAVSWSDLPAAYAALDVFAMPCRTRRLGTDVEGLGMVYLEAQATGIPVIAGRSGGAPEAVRDGETGLVVDGDEPLSVAAAIVRLLDDPAARRDMGAAGRRWVEGTWSWARIATRFRALLEDVAGTGS